MKRVFNLLALVMVISMLVMAVAAVPFVGDIETKDSPEVILVPDKEKELVEARIVDPVRVELETLEDEELIVTSIREAREIRKELKQEGAKEEELPHQRLLDAYEQLLGVQHWEDIIPGITEALSRKSTTLTVPELIVHDLFDLTSEADEAELLDEGKAGNFITITFETEIPEDQLIFVVQNYEEDKWRIVPDEMLVHRDETIVGVTIDDLDPIAFLVPPGFGGSEGDGNFVPSAEREDAFRLFGIPHDEDRIVVVVEDPEEEDISKVMPGEITVTSVEQNTGILTRAYEQIKNAETLAELVPELPQYLQETAPGVKAGDLVVRELFDITLTGDDPVPLAEKGNTVTFIFEMGLKPNEALAVLHNYEADKWELIPADQIVCHPSGNVSVTFEDLSPIALAVAPIPAEVQETVAEPKPAAAEAPEEQSGSTPVVLGLGAVAVIVIAGVIYYKKKR